MDLRAFLGHGKGLAKSDAAKLYTLLSAPYRHKVPWSGKVMAALAVAVAPRNFRRETFSVSFILSSP